MTTRTGATRQALAAAAALLGLWGCSPKIEPPTLADVNEKGIAALESDPGTWWTNGRTFSEQRYSPLTQINTGTAQELGLAWEADLESPRFGIEASPVMVGGVLYVSSSWGRVFAFDAKTGRRLWAFDPEVPGAWLRNGCCKPVNRGVAVWNGRVFVGAFDGRLIALDGKTGRKLWEANTTDSKPYYTITGAPRVVKGKVIIGNGGADFATRGFFSAYDAETGTLAWRFYVVPDDPKKGFERPEMERAAKTWGPGHDWSLGGGGNPWDSFSYDPELDLLYVGTGNAGPYGMRDPAKGDGLFLASILAVDPDDGHLVWHYQTVPGESWDYTATSNMILADLDIGGARRKVLMQAPKNGFFYVLDRATGELLSAGKYVRVNWASHIDLKTGRPVFTGQGEFEKGPRLLFPGPAGAHSWNPMAFNPQTGLVYLPVRDIGWIWGAERTTWFQSGYDLSKLTNDPDVQKDTYAGLLAWDPVRQKPAWTVRHDTMTNGGVLTTAGGLVVQGTEDGHLRVYAADDGRLLQDIETGTGIAAPPVSYAVDGQQYIAIAAGWNGVKMAPWTPERAEPYSNAGRLIVLKLGGRPVPVAPRVPLPPFYAGDEPQPAAMVAKGAGLYQMNCGMCHGVMGEGGVFPDLRRMAPGIHESFVAIVREGLLARNGMAGFADTLSVADVEAIRAFVVDWAQRSRRGDYDSVPPALRVAGAPVVRAKTPGL